MNVLVQSSMQCWAVGLLLFNVEYTAIGNTANTAVLPNGTCQQVIVISEKIFVRKTGEETASLQIKTSMICLSVSVAQWTRPLNRPQCLLA